MTSEGPVRDGEIAASKQVSYELVPLTARRVLDVGCGAGEDVLALAERLGTSVLVVGLDVSLERIDEAQRAARNVALNVRFAVGDARSLPFSDESFDVVRVDGLLGVADERVRVVRELVRVTTPGGRVLVHDEADAVLTCPQQSPTGDDDLLGLLRRAGLSGVELSETPPRASASPLRRVTLVGIKPTQLELAARAST